MLFSLALLLFYPVQAEEVGEDSEGSFVIKKGYESYDTQELMERVRWLQNQDSVGSSYEAPVSIFLDGRYMGDILSLVNHEGRPPKLKYRDLLRLMVDRLGPEQMERLGDLQDLRGWVSLDGLEAFNPIFNEQLLNIHLKTPAGMRDEGRIDLSGAYFPDLSELQGPAPCSAFVSFYNQFNYEDDEFHYLLNLEPSFRKAPWVFEGRFEFDFSRNPVFDFSNIRFFKDWPEDLRRLTVGETQSFRPRLLVSDRIYGVKYSTEYDLRPNVVTEPISEYSFLLQRDSTVEIWVNGRLQQTLRLKEGPYDLSNFPLLIGYNNVVLRIVDDLGREQTLTFDTIKGPSLLRPGMAEFSYSIGLRGRGKEVEGGPLIGLASRHGLTDQFTSSFELRGDSRHLATSIGGDFATGFCFGTYDLGFSLTPCSEGFASRLILGRNFTCMAVSLRWDYRDKNYFEQKQYPWQERLKSLHELSVIFPSFSTLGSVRLYAIRSNRWNGPKEQRELFEWDMTINERWESRVALGYSHFDANKEDRFQASWRITYNWFSPDFRRRHEAFLDRKHLSFFNTAGGNPVRKLGDWNLDHSRFIDDKGKASDNIRAAFRYRAPRFHAYYTGEVGEYGDENNIKHSLDFNTALVYVPGAWSIGPPVLNSFAIIKPDEKLKDLTIRAYAGGERGKATPGLPAVISNLRAYWPAFITVEIDSPDLWLELPPFQFFAHEKSGVLFTVSNPEGEGFSNTVEGILLDVSGAPVSFQALKVENRTTGGEEPVISFTNEKGVFRVGGVHAGYQYRIYVGYMVDSAYYEGEPYYEFVVPSNREEPFQANLGMLELMVPDENSNTHNLLPAMPPKRSHLPMLLKQLQMLRTGKSDAPQMAPPPFSLSP